jgi:hypothetical protein
MPAWVVLIAGKEVTISSEDETAGTAAVRWLVDHAGATLYRGRVDG